MELYVQVFEPRIAPNGAWPGLLTLCLLLGAAWVWVLRKPSRLDRNRQMLLGMLLFIALLLGLFTTGGMIWQSFRYQTIRVEATELYIGQKRIKFEELRGYYVREIQGVSILNPQQARGVAYALVIEEENGRVHTLPDACYDLPALVAALDAVWEAWREKK